MCSIEVEAVVFTSQQQHIRRTAVSAAGLSGELRQRALELLLAVEAARGKVRHRDHPAVPQRRRCGPNLGKMLDALLDHVDEDPRAVLQRRCGAIGCGAIEGADQRVLELRRVGLGWAELERRCTAKLLQPCCHLCVDHDRGLHRRCRLCGRQRRSWLALLVRIWRSRRPQRGPASATASATSTAAAVARAAAHPQPQRLRRAVQPMLSEANTTPPSAADAAPAPWEKDDWPVRLTHLLHPSLCNALVLRP